MATKHGIFVSEKADSAVVPVVSASGIPFVVGTAPLHKAATPAAVGIPVLVESWQDAVEKFGYSDDWETYTLCEVMYSHFKLYGCSPVIFVNLVDPAVNKVAAESATAAVASHKASIDESYIITGLTVASGESTLEAGSDYELFYDGDKLIIELLSTGSAYSAASLTVGGNKISTSAINATAIAAALETVELCVTTTGLVPDLILAPKYSQGPSVAAAMAAKAESINGLFQAKALIDLNASSVTSYSAVLTAKETAGLTAEAEIVCWPMATFGDKTYHMSTLVAGLIASVDADNDGCPYASPSNHAIKADGLVLADGTAVNLTYQQANTVNAAGVVTALSFIGGWRLWGNYTAAYPETSNAKEMFIPVSRMFDWVGNSVIQSFWTYLDMPMNRRLIDTITDSCNIWLNGLVGRGYLLGARVEFNEADNPLVNLMAGKIKLHIYMTPPSPAQEIDFVLEYDADYVVSALS